ncbi:N-acetyltransferase [Deinococcus detaillensis]|uniref:N-acetyltransferase n=1 Tax=Deinococcus detaillensis TaxID=2592048 RepID=A0A553UWQ4_9DEIO|nr:GNAT family N-acetyltransferase [Deinococcus detaillensis]TSA84638.1 N-acetyltransferase [Deinococcus detaillensis]
MESDVIWEVLHPQPLLSDQLYGELAAFLGLAENKNETADHLRRFDEQRSAGQHHALTLAHVDGQLVGVAETQVPRSHDKAGWYALSLSVHPDWQGGELPQALLSRAETQLPPDAQVVLATVREGEWQMAFLEAQGFAEYERMWTSTLDLQTFSPTDFQHHTERARRAGLRALPISEVADLSSESEQRRLYTLMIHLLSEVPFAEPITPWPFETWKSRILDAPEFDVRGFFMLLSPEGEWIGVSELYRPDPSKLSTLHQGLTGVRREWRGLGGGWLLKLTAAAQAKARGYGAANTTNHTGNTPMLAINERMGFVRERARVGLRREMRA